MVLYCKSVALSVRGLLRNELLLMTRNCKPFFRIPSLISLFNELSVFPVLVLYRESFGLWLLEGSVFVITKLICQFVGVCLSYVLNSADDLVL